MALNLLCSQGWLELWSPFASTSQVLELRACAVMPGLCSAGNRTQDFTHARRDHYQLSYIPSFCINILRCWDWIWHQACSQESVYKGTGMLLSGRMLMGRPGFESQHRKLCVCAHVCVSVLLLLVFVFQFWDLNPLAFTRADVILIASPWVSFFLRTLYICW